MPCKSGLRRPSSLSHSCVINHKTVIRPNTPHVGAGCQYKDLSFTPLRSRIGKRQGGLNDCSLRTARWRPVTAAGKEDAQSETAVINDDWAPKLMLPMALLGANLLLSTMAVAADAPLLVSQDYVGGGYISAFLLILFSEIGDKTFFIAVLLSLQNSRSAIFTGTFGALAIMTFISVIIGQSFHRLDDLIPEQFAQFPLDDIFAAALLIAFGVQTLLAAKDADDKVVEEENDAREAVSGISAGSGSLILSTFGLVFAAEWGDKSFLATAALSAAASPAGVCLGAISGHAVATIIAVLGGSFLSKYVSEKSIQYVGGGLFLVFAAGTLVDLYMQVRS